MSAGLAALDWLPPPPGDFRDRCRALGLDGARPGPAAAFLAGHDLDAASARALSRALARLIDAGADLDPLTPLRLAVLPCAGFDLVADALPAAAARHGVALSLHVAPAEQVEAALLNPASGLAAFNPDLVFVDLTPAWLDLAQPALEPGAAEARVVAAIDRIEELARDVRARLSVPVVLQTLPPPSAALFGSVDRLIDGAPRRMVHRVDAALVELCRTSDALLFDAAAVAQTVGDGVWRDDRLSRMYGLPFAPAAVPLYADRLARLLGAFRGRSRKCLVLDLDNTCWGGVVGDDGVAALEIGPGTPLGESHADVQRLALALKARGVFLAVASRNDDQTARAPFREHPGMLLKEADISVFQANWNPKADNLEAIAEALSLGLDALVLLDDNPAERAAVRAALPQVAVPELPNDPAGFAATLAASGLFEAMSFTDEDRARGTGHLAEARRVEVRAQARDLGDYLKALEMRLDFEPLGPINRVRAAQLIARSNQFNLTTRRHDAARLEALEREAAFTLCARLSDRFGDFGLVSLVIALPVADAVEPTWELDTWLMSCRVLGRRVEEGVMARLAEAARAAGVVRLEGVYRQTSKNMPVADHYPRLGFTRGGDTPEGQRHVLRLADWRAPTLPFRSGSD
jgi:FkbH-like protein